MSKLLIFASAALFLASCSKEEKPQPKPDDVNPRGVIRLLDNETDPHKVENWFTKGPSQNVEGVDVERAYGELSLSPISNEIIVAVIDGGIDVNHEDLKGRIWVNTAEANGVVGVDDDKNGYIDDINGWNFLGGYDASGKPISVNEDRLESTRELARLRKIKENGGQLSSADEAYFEKLDYEVTGDRNVVSFQIYYTQNALDRIEYQFDIIKSQLNFTFDQITVENMEAFSPTDDAAIAAKDKIVTELNTNRAKSVQRLQLRIEDLKFTLETELNENFDPRTDIVKDDPNDFSSGTYGNNDVVGPDAYHGTHVAGIIAANRYNNIGIAGISPYAKIMALRAVPNGDEYDKDIYYSVKYAVDNGAKIINMSFGKSYSPHKSKMDTIFKYAAARGVLLIHAAGNESHDNDKTPNFPSRYLSSVNSEAEIKTWIEVGASSRYNTTILPGVFSNYGKKSVDIFAPGVEIKSTTPDNEYEYLSGTSMAAPTVAGVASVLWAQKSDASASEIRSVLLANGRNKKLMQVSKPGTAEEFLFGDLSRTGSVVDNYSALKQLAHPQ